MFKIIINEVRNGGIISLLKKTILFLGAKIRNFKSQTHYSFYKLKAKNGYLVKEIQYSKMLLDMSDVGISKELTLTGVHEKNSTAFYKEKIKKGMHVAEFGANIGYYALIASHLVGDNGIIYAFEPAPDNFSLLKKNIELNNKQNIFKLYNAGLGSEDTEIDFYIYSKKNMSSFIVRKQLGDIKIINSIKVKVIKPDNFFKDKKVDFIRMDVEGFEVDILSGMHEILSRKDKPKGLFIEIHSELLHKRNTTAKEFILKICSYGYEIEQSLYRGKNDISVYSKQQQLSHPLLEKGYWETFFKAI